MERIRLGKSCVLYMISGAYEPPKVAKEHATRFHHNPNYVTLTLISFMEGHLVMTISAVHHRSCLFNRRRALLFNRLGVLGILLLCGFK